MTDPHDTEPLYVPFTGEREFSIWAVDPGLQLISNVTEENAGLMSELYPQHIYFFAELCPPDGA